MAANAGFDHALLLGESETVYKDRDLTVLPSGRVVAALSVGADPRSPALAHKGDPDRPNEDAVLVMERGDRALLAVADAHYGCLASHALLSALAERLTDLPASPMDLGHAVRAAAMDGRRTDSSGSTLLIAVLHRRLGGGFGFSWGDSTCTLLGAGLPGEPLPRPNAAFVHPQVPWTLETERASFFEFDLPAGGLLAAFTDGIHECHYGHPETSLGPAQFTELFQETGPDPHAFAERLIEAAHAGRAPHPGGQDNIALAVAAT